jgi:cytochrome c551
MRAPFLVTAVLVAASVFIAGCGGPKDSDESLSAACERQIEQINEESHGSSTPTAKSTDERLDSVTLKHCAGQDVVLASPDQLAGGEGSEDGKDEGSSDEGTDAEGEGDEGEGGGEPAQLDPAARDLFSEKCASCHTLSDAGASGAVGPNLDDIDLDADAIEKQIINGGGAMPPGLLQGEDAAKVAEYVAAARDAG